MLSHRLWTTPARRFQYSYRTYSDSQVQYHPKVRAIPFQLSEQDAIQRMGVWASLLSTGQKILGSLGARYLPSSFGFKPLQPIRIQATYLPVWCIDLAVDAKAWVTLDHNEGPVKHTLSANFDSCYMPGFNMKSICNTSLNYSNVAVREAVPFSDALRTQHGSDILCLPFTLSPFPLIDIARSLSLSQASLSERIRLDPTTVKQNMFAAYPYLMPVYIAQYPKHPMIPQSIDFAMMLVAHNQEGVVIAENTIGEYARIIKDEMHYKIPTIMDTVAASSKDLLTVSTLEPHFAYVTGLFSTTGVLPKEIWQLLENKVNAAFDKSGTMTFLEKTAKALGSKGVDFEDLRVRPFTIPELMENKLWMMTRVSRQYSTSMLNQLPEYVGNLNLVKFLGTASSFSEKDLHRAKPQWLREWEKSIEDTS